VLGVSRQQVDNLLRNESLRRSGGGVARESVVAEFERRRAMLEERLRGMSLAAAALGIATDGPTRERSPADEEDVRRTLEQERLGRAVAEARIDELRRNLARANRAIQALMPAAEDMSDVPEPD